MEPISIRYRLTEPEFMAACDAHWTAHRLSTLPNLVLGALGIILGLLFLYFIFWLALILFAVGALLILLTWLRSFFWRKAFRETKKYQDDIRVVVRDDSIHVEGLEGRSDLNWEFFTWYLDTPRHILLYPTKRNFSVIPKAAFPDEESIQRFLGLVRSRLRPIRPL